MKFLDRIKLKAAHKLARMMDLERFCEWQERREGGNKSEHGFVIEGGKLIKYIEQPGVTDVVIPDGVTEIGDGAFRDCESLTSVIIPNGVKIIGEAAFCGCSSLKSVTIPDSVTTIGDCAFWDCENLGYFVLGKGVTEIGRSLVWTYTVTPIFAPKGSYAIEYAKENEIPYVEV